MEIKEKLEKIGINYDNLDSEKIQIYNLIYDLAQRETKKDLIQRIELTQKSYILDGKILLEEFGNTIWFGMLPNLKKEIKP